MATATSGPGTTAPLRDVGPPAPAPHDEAPALPALPADPEGISHDERAELTAAYVAVAAHAAATGDHEARAEAVSRIVLVNMRIARSVAHRYRGRGVAAEDLEQVAYLALVRVAGTFDPTAGHDFLAFAVPSITGELRRHFRDHGWVIRPPRPVQRAHGRLVNERIDLDRCSVGALAEVAERTGEDLETIREALRLRALMRPVSLDGLRGGDGEAETTVEVADERLAFEHSSVARVALASASRRLPERDRQLLHWRFVEELSQREIAERMGVSQVSVSRMLTRLLGQLRAEIGAAA